VTKPEALTAFEVGTKNQFLNNRLRVDADVYLYDYKDRQYSCCTTAAMPTVLCPNGQLPLRFGPVDVRHTSKSYLQAFDYLQNIVNAAD
jgi:iron complex outermembrane receptor protein